VPVIERPFSDLLRHPKDVAGDVENGDVVLRRRDQPDLRLTRADRETQRTAAFSALARAFGHLAARNPDEVADMLADAFAWTEFLPDSDRRLFVAEFARLLTAAAEVDNYAPLSQLIHEWRATAEVHADPALARRLRRPLDLEAAGAAVPAPGS